MTPTTLATGNAPPQIRERASSGAAVSGALTGVAAEPSQAMQLPMSVVSQCQRVASSILCDRHEHVALAVTSAMPGEGVSTVAAGIAVSLAAATNGIVGLVDANLVDPRAHALLGVPRAPGLREGIEAEHDATGAIRAFRTELPNLWVLPAGEPDKRPVQILTSEAARTYLARLRGSLDYLVIDTPPLLTSVEAENVCRFAGQALIVTRARATQRSQVRHALRVLDGVPVLGAVLLRG